ncbi:hypothetical protein EDD11_008022 [Mortierella claussenii]|nr:hypothetical protein EDD11_008022 [Mortierella claussenii]
MTPSEQINNTRVLISKVPEGVSPNNSHFRSIHATEDVPSLKENELWLKNIIFSLDPYIRHEIAEGQDEAVVVGYGIARVLESTHPDYPAGSLVFAPAKWETYSHLFEPHYLSDVTVLDTVIDPNVPLSAYTGILGVPGFTVWDSFNAIGNLKAGETIYISSAAGTLGQIAGQLAKRRGLRVIGSAGTDEKVAYLREELKFDAAFNYKTQDTRVALTEALHILNPENGGLGLDIYYDLVGDDNVDIALDLLNPRGRILAVGSLAFHQNKAPVVLKNFMNILVKELRCEGYLVFDRYENFGKFWEEMTPLVANGEIKQKETVLNQGTDTLGETYVKFLNGAFSGKVNVQVAEI